eukprot:GFUD01000994.1.p1 GENE.GFUD01000994.1~~GFUD01000994.1.p1  ORF type:complete len:183 (-),score=46.02 GFUD01000994.1:106-654(-)
MPKGSKPKGWLMAPRTGTKVEGTPCVPMKTPISTEGWNISTMAATCPNVKLLIDLTAKEYFAPSKVCRRNIEYKKIKANYGDRSPSTEAVNEFIQTVAEFLEDHEDDDEAEIAVVCTYGTNRSGYLICRYLMEIEDLEPEEAIDRFETARGEPFDPKKPILKAQLLKGLEYCEEQENLADRR